MSRPLSDIAKVIRSKNAGPFMITIDIMFDTEADYRYVRDKNVINDQSVTELYGLSEGELVGIFYADYCLSIKVTLISRIPSGDFGGADVYGAQQYIPFLSMPVP